MSIRTIFLSFASAALTASFAYSTSVFDSRWSNMGGVSPGVSIRGIVFTSNKEFYAFGDFDSVGNVPVNKIAKWTSLGWQTPITGKTWKKVSALSVDRNGRLVVLGTCDSGVANIPSNLALWNGSEWVPIPLSTGGSVATMISDNAGNVIVGGTFSNIRGIPANSIAKWDGFTWSALGSGTDSGVCAMAFDNNTGALYVASQGRNYAMVNKWIGGTWTPMSIYNMQIIDALAVAPNGDLLVVGMTPGAGSRPLTFIEYNGTSWSSLGSSPGDEGNFNSVCFDTNGKLFAAGNFQVPGGGWNWCGMESWNGQSWKTYDIPNNIYSITKSPSGSLFACGDYGIYSLTDTTWSKVGAPASNMAFTSIVRDAGGTLYLASDSLVYAWDGLVFRQLGQGLLGGPIVRLRVDSKGVLYAAGNQGRSGVDMGFVQKWNDSAWVSIGTFPGGWEIYGMNMAPEDKVYIISSCFVMRWDDTGWTKIGLSFTNNKAGTAITFDNIGNVYKANNGDIWVENDTGWVIPQFWSNAKPAGFSAAEIFFDRAGHAFVSGLQNAKLAFLKQDGGTFRKIGEFYASEFDPNIFSHCFDSKNNLYISGYFDGVHPTIDSFISAKEVVMWDGASWNSLGIGVGDNTNYYGIKDIAVDADDRVYIAGMFDKAGGMVCSNFSIYCASGMQSRVLPKPNPAVRKKESISVSVFMGALHFRNISPQDRIYAYSVSGKLLRQSSGKPVIELHGISRQPLLLRIFRNAKVIFSRMIVAQ